MPQWSLGCLLWAVGAVDACEVESTSVVVFATVPLSRATVLALYSTLLAALLPSGRWKQLQLASISRRGTGSAGAWTRSAVLLLGALHAAELDSSASQSALALYLHTRTRSLYPQPEAYASVTLFFKLL
jgi:hypothetical protein